MIALDRLVQNSAVYQGGFVDSGGCSEGARGQSDRQGNLRLQRPLDFGAGKLWNGAAAKDQAV